MNISGTEPLHLFYFSVQSPFTLIRKSIWHMQSSAWSILIISLAR